MQNGRRLDFSGLAKGARPMRSMLRWPWRAGWRSVGCNDVAAESDAVARAAQGAGCHRFRVLVIASLLLALLGVMLLDHLARARLARQAGVLAAQQAEGQRMDAIVAQVEQIRAARATLLVEQAELVGLRVRQALLPDLF
jgi:hypothetical protein